MKSYVHDQVGNNTEHFASGVKNLAANTSELFPPSSCALFVQARALVSQIFC
jgi:hypothetical protein